LVTVLFKADSFSCLGLLAQNLQQVPRKTSMNMTQNCHYVGRNSYRVHLEYNPHALPIKPNGLVMLETYTVCVPTWNSICEWSRSMA